MDRFGIGNARFETFVVGVDWDDDGGADVCCGFCDIDVDEDDLTVVVVVPVNDGTDVVARVDANTNDGFFATFCNSEEEEEVAVLAVVVLVVVVVVVVDKLLGVSLDDSCVEVDTGETEECVSEAADREA